MNSRHDSRRARQDGTQRIGHDPRRGASSPQWNREAQMQNEQFQGRHGSRHDNPYDSPYGGQYGGYENSREPQHLPQGSRRWHPEEEAYGQRWHGHEGGQDFGGYGDFDEEMQDPRGFDDRPRSHGAPWQRRGQVPNQFSRDDQYRSSAAQGRRHDPDYEQWRREQMQQLDEDYEAYRRERYGKFADDFNAWRAGRAGQSPGSDTGREDGAKSGNKQQG